MARLREKALSDSAGITSGSDVAWYWSTSASSYVLSIAPPGLVVAQIRSRINAMPCPPPTHMVIRPVVLSWKSRLLIIVFCSRAPVIP